MTPSSSVVNGAREIVHHAFQVLARGAIANLPARPDDSHTSAVWDEQSKELFTDGMDVDGGQCRIGLGFSPLHLSVVCPNDTSSSLRLDGMTTSEVYSWVDERLCECGLSPTSKSPLAYSVPKLETGCYAAPPPILSALTALRDWYSCADTVLNEFFSTHSELSREAKLRCWPHHFDMGAYFPLEVGDPETAKAISVGMSPGDEVYAQPYFYVTPWPYPDTCALPDLGSLGHWHVNSYVGAVATAEKLLQGGDVATNAKAFLEAAFSHCLALLDRHKS